MHTCDTKHAKRHPCGVRAATAVIPVAPLEGRLSIAHRRQVQRASGALVRSSSRGRGPACSACVLLAMPSRALGVRCGARLGRAGPRLTALRPESNLHPDVPTGPTPPCSPPLITGAGLDLDDRGRGWGWGRWRWNAPRSATVGFWVARVGGGAERRAPRTWQKPASCQVALQRGGVPRGGPGLVTSFHRPHTCSLRRFELSRSEARAAKAHVQMRAWQEASRGTPWDSSPPTAGGRPETVGERDGVAGFGGWLPGSAATRDDAPGVGVFGAGGARGRQAGGGEVSLPVGLRLWWVGGCLEERQHVRLPKEARAYTTARRQD